MTRETKIGLAIATTFLSLVGLVVASKMRRPDASAEPMVAVQPDAAKSAANSSAQPPAAHTPGSGGPAGQGSEGPPVQPTGPLDGVPAKKKENEPPPLQQVQNPTNDGLPAVPAIPAPLQVQPAGGPPVVDAKSPYPGLPQASAKPAGGFPLIESDPLVITPLTQGEPKKFAAMPPTTGPLVDPAPLKVAGAAEPGSVELPQPPPIALKDSLPKDPLPANPIGLPELPAANGPFSSPIQLPQSIDPLKQKPEPMPIVTPLPSQDAIQPKLDIKVGIPTLPEKKGADPVPPPLTGGVIAPIAPAPKGESIGTIGNTGGEIRITSPVTPGSPAPLPSGGVPLLPTGNNSLPKVTNHEDKTHVTQPGDTSFDELSKTLYGTPVYARALLEYNRQHVLATANLKQDPPILRANQRIYYPDKNILEIQYQQLIHGAAAAPVAVAPTVKITLVGPGSVSGTNPPTADATVAYRLTQPQFIFDIARQQLGDGLLWPEILRLNPVLHTDQPIPAGTELRLPKVR